MSAFINYLIEANVGLCFFLLVYAVLLTSETNFNFKRAYLLLGMLTSLIFPLLKLGDQNEVLPTLSIVLPEVTTTNDTTTSSSIWLPENFATLILWIYLAGVTFFALRLVVQLLNLRFYLRKASLLRESNNCKIVETQNAIPSFSFFHYILLGNAGQLSPADKEQIIEHESVHVDHLHSLDLLLVEGLGILFWFDPAIRIYKKIFKSVHEFIADKKTIETHDTMQYVSLLTKVALLSADFPLANHFNNTLTFKRIIMMKTLKRKMEIWKMAAIVPAFLAFMFLASCQDQVKSSEAMPLDDEIFTVVEEMPTYIGGMDALKSYLQKELKYPAQARVEGVEGKVFVSFVITKEGNLVSPEVIKGVREDMDQAALRVVSGLPKWNPARQKGRAVNVRFVLPINFKLNN